MRSSVQSVGVDESAYAGHMQFPDWSSNDMQPRRKAQRLRCWEGGRAMRSRLTFEHPIQRWRQNCWTRYRIACNFRGVKISFILKKEIFVSKNFVLPGSGRGRRCPTRFSWVKNFVEVSSLTKITKFLPHENYTLYGTAMFYI